MIGQASFPDANSGGVYKVSGRDVFNDEVEKIKNRNPQDKIRTTYYGSIQVNDRYITGILDIHKKIRVLTSVEDAEEVIAKWRKEIQNNIYPFLRKNADKINLPKMYEELSNIYDSVKKLEVKKSNDSDHRYLLSHIAKTINNLTSDLD